ncbi:MAG: type II toxin-antitoxin system Phd/YefM family antitoxin [Sphingosinicella sp.]|uniref:type II toxin-antitoxin system Phd/YefM family antitoxin n=1 Tax=Sphingosinicella sp. TaxID=1917971 RepID=UPI0040380683
MQASEVRQSFSEFVDECWARGRRTVIQRNGKPVAALVSIADLQSLLEADRQQSEAMLREMVAEEAGDLAPATAAAHEQEKEKLHGAANEMIACATRMIVPIAVKAVEEAIRNKRSRRELGPKDESALTERVLAEIDTAP